MDKEKNLALLEALSNADGVSGFEDEVLLPLRKAGEGLGEFKEDCLRNLYLHRAGNTGGRPLIQLDAHTDEVGLMVQCVTPAGTLQFVPLGGWVPASLSAQRMRVHTKSGRYIPGIVASKPPHFMNEADRKAPPSLENMVIDVGACSAEEAVQQFGVYVGAPVVPEAHFAYDAEHDLMTGKAFDCRLGCGALAVAMQRLHGKALHADVVAAYATQEEVGLRGARVAAHTLKPDVAIVFEGTPADDTFAPAHALQTALKKGPMLRHIDSGMITNPRFQRFALNLAEELNIPVQQAVRTGGGTNGGAIHLAASGVPVIVIALPVRYIHSHNGIASYHDFEAAVQLGCAVIERLTPDVIASF